MSLSDRLDHFEKHVRYLAESGQDVALAGMHEIGVHPRGEAFFKPVGGVGGGYAYDVRNHSEIHLVCFVRWNGNVDDLRGLEFDDWPEDAQVTELRELRRYF